VSLVDVAPTVLDLLGLPASTTMDGRTLRPLLADDRAERDAFSQTYYGEGLVSYRSGQMKYVFKPARAAGPRAGSDPPFPDEAEEWLYDLGADPAEKTNLLEARADTVATMRGRLQEWLRAQEAHGRGRPAELPQAGGVPRRVLGDPQLERQLRALGYLD
jgi:arylsulfatase A-like enzyme